MPTPRKTVAQLKMTGHLRPDRRPGRADVLYPPSTGDPPSYLQGVARAEYIRLAALMIERGTLTEADVQTLAVYAKLGAEIHAAEDVPASKLQTWLAIGRDLGLTPASRAKVSPGVAPKPKENDWTQFIRDPRPANPDTKGKA